MKTPGKPGGCPDSIAGGQLSRGILTSKSATWRSSGQLARRLREERGSGTVMALGLILLGITLTLGVAQVAVAAAGSTAAHGAADLAALMAATDVLTGGSGCGTAGEYATKNHVQLVSCQVNGWMVRVEVLKPLGFGIVTEARAAAKAGPEFADQ